MSIMMHNLARLLSGLWDKIKRDSPEPAPSVSEGDIVIFVVGPTGSGKSWFIKEATKSGLVKSSISYHPFTTKVQAIRCEPTDEAKEELRKEGVNSIVLVDTPSFHTGCDEIDAQKEIRTWIDRIERTPRYLGMIYMHRIETDPALEPIENHIKYFPVPSRLRQDNLPLRLHVVVSYDKTSANISESKTIVRKSALHEQVERLNGSKWQPSIHSEYFQGEPKVAWGAVETLLQAGTSDM